MEQRERTRVPQNMIHNQSTHFMEVGEQISIMPLEDKDHLEAFKFQLHSLVNY
jgi:hypothetical protein